MKITMRKILDELRARDEGCKYKIPRLTRLLRRFYLDTNEIPLNYVSEEITDTEKIVSTHPIYRVIAFVASGVDDKFCIKNHKTIKTGNGLDVLMMGEVHGGELGSGTYNVVDEHNVNIALPSGALTSYFIYARGPEDFTSLDDEIDIHPKMLIGLQHLIESFYYEMQGEVNRYKIAKEDYMEWLMGVKKSEEHMTYKVSVGGNIGDNAVFTR